MMHFQRVFNYFVIIHIMISLYNLGSKKLKKKVINGSFKFITYKFNKNRIKMNICYFIQSFLRNFNLPPEISSQRQIYNENEIGPNTLLLYVLVSNARLESVDLDKRLLNKFKTKTTNITIITLVSGNPSISGRCQQLSTGEIVIPIYWNLFNGECILSGSYNNASFEKLRELVNTNTNLNTNVTTPLSYNSHKSYTNVQNNVNCNNPTLRKDNKMTTNCASMYYFVQSKPADLPMIKQMEGATLVNNVSDISNRNSTLFYFVYNTARLESVAMDMYLFLQFKNKVSKIIIVEIVPGNPMTSYSTTDISSGDKVITLYCILDHGKLIWNSEFNHNKLEVINNLLNM